MLQGIHLLVCVLRYSTSRQNLERLSPNFWCFYCFVLDTSYLNLMITQHRCKYSLSYLSCISCILKAKWPSFVYFQISSFRESKSDDRRFYIFSPTKTLHLRTYSKKDRVAWIEALVSSSCVISLNEQLSFRRNNISFSTERLRNHMRSEGLGEELIQDCEKIMRSEFSEYHRQLKAQYDEHLTILNTYDSQLEVLFILFMHCDSCITLRFFILLLSYMILL